MKTAIMFMLVTMCLGTWGIWIAGLIRKVDSKWLKPMVWAMIVLTPFTVVYGTYYGAE